MLLDLTHTEDISFFQTLKAQSENFLDYVGPCAFGQTILIEPLDLRQRGKGAVPTS